jgi:formate dehydrogenase major subunit
MRTMLTKRSSGLLRPRSLGAAAGLAPNPDLSRRGFLQRSGVTAGNLALLGALQGGLVRKADAQAADKVP